MFIAREPDLEGALPFLIPAAILLLTIIISPTFPDDGDSDDE